MACASRPDCHEHDEFEEISLHTAVRSKVRLPPAEPGASFCEPLEAACAGSLTRPRLSWATLSVAGYFHMFSWSIRLSSCSWLRM
jgi:hypothetical protein